MQCSPARALTRSRPRSRPRTRPRTRTRSRPRPRVRPGRLRCAPGNSRPTKMPEVRPRPNPVNPTPPPGEASSARCLPEPRAHAITPLPRRTPDARCRSAPPPRGIERSEIPPRASRPCNRAPPPPSPWRSSHQAPSPGTGLRRGDRRARVTGYTGEIPQLRGTASRSARDDRERQARSEERENGPTLPPRGSSAARFPPKPCAHASAPLPRRTPGAPATRPPSPGTGLRRGGRGPGRRPGAAPRSAPEGPSAGALARGRAGGGIPPPVKGTGSGGRGLAGEIPQLRGLRPLRSG